MFQFILRIPGPVAAGTEEGKNSNRQSVAHLNAGIHILRAGRLFKVNTANEVATSPTQPDDLLPRAMHVGPAKWAGGQR